MRHFLTLIKVRITALVTLTAMAGYGLAPGREIDAAFWATALGVFLITAGASTVQVVEDLRATAARTAWVRSELAMTGPAGTRYALEPDGRRYVRMTDASGSTVTKPEWEPPPPAPPDRRARPATPRSWRGPSAASARESPWAGSE